MAYFQTKLFKPQNPNLVKLWRVLQLKMSVYLMAILSILWSFGTFCVYLVYFMSTWYILRLVGTFFPFGMFYQEKSGNPDWVSSVSVLLLRGKPLQKNCQACENIVGM
jgi:hypothetical protein